MEIKYAILGFLSWNSFSGYELKKIFMDSPYFYWSGSNNQIYQTLVQFHKDGLVDVEVTQDLPHPPKKTYTITTHGMDELKRWLSLPPELPQIRNSFLAQLAWADILDDKAVNTLLDGYHHEIEMQIAMLKEKEQRGVVKPNRTKREELLWDMISNNVIQSYEHELNWIISLITKLNEIPME